MGGVLFIIGAALQAGAVHLGMISVGRIMLGFGVGLANQVGLPAQTPSHCSAENKGEHDAFAADRQGLSELKPCLRCDSMRDVPQWHCGRQSCRNCTVPHAFEYKSKVGNALQSVPMYLSEIAPPKLRGALNFMFQLATTSGILIAQLVNYGVLPAPLHFSA